VVKTRGAPIIGRFVYRPNIGQFADNRYQPFDNRPIICFSKQNNKNTFKLKVLTAIHLDNNEIMRPLNTGMGWARP